MTAAEKGMDISINDEVVAAYNEILFQLKDSKKVTVEDPVEIEKVAVIETLSKDTPEQAMQYFDQLRRSLLSGIEDIREKYLAEQKKLLQLVEAIEVKSKALSDLHQIEINIDSLSALLRAHKEKSETFEKEMTEQRTSFEQEMNQKQKDAQQEEQRYISQRDMARMKERNQYEVAKRALEQELATTRQKFDKEMSQRETRILASEQALAQLEHLQDKVARFPDELQNVVRTAEETTTQALTMKFDYEMQLAKKEMRVYEQTIATLETKIALLESNITRFESLKDSFSRLLLNPAEG